MRSGCLATALAKSSVYLTAAALRGWSPIAPTSAECRQSRLLRRLRFSGPEIAELLGMPLSTVSGILTRIGMGRLGRLGLEPAERYERERPGELYPHRCQETRPHPGRCRASDRPAVAHVATRTFTRPDGQAAHRQSVGIYVHIAIDELHPAGLRQRSYPTRKPAPRSSSLGARDRLLPPPRHHRRARAHRQWLASTAPRSIATPSAAPCQSAILRTRPRRPQTNGKPCALHPAPCRRRLRLRQRSTRYVRTASLVARSGPTPSPPTLSHRLQPPRHAAELPTQDYN